MLNKDGQRELVYAIYIDEIIPIEGADRVEVARVGGWRVMVRKGQFQPGDPAIYFEIDSKVPETEVFEFLAQKHYKIKTQKYFKGTVISQGLVMAAEDFGWKIDSAQFAGGMLYIVDDKGEQHIPGDENTMFLTKKLGVTYAVEEDNKRKANSNPDAKINAALNRHPKIAKKYGKIIKKNKFLRWAFLLIFGRKKDVRNWPAEVRKTDEERIENRIWTLEDGNKEWIATEKIDGTSTTFHLRRKKGFKPAEFFVCSRNVVFDTPDKNNKNYYADTIGSNVYLDMSEKYNVREVLEKLLQENPDAEWITLQGETFGAKVQKRDYGMKDRDFRAFNLIYSNTGRLNTLDMIKTLNEVGIPSVPIVREKMTLPSTIDELRAFVHNETSAIDGKIKEGIVFRSMDGVDSFKCVDPEFLVKYHQ